MGNPVETKEILEKSKSYHIVCRYESENSAFAIHGYIIICRKTLLSPKSTYQEESTHEMVSLFSPSILAGPIGGPGIPPIIMMLI